MKRIVFLLSWFVLLGTLMSCSDDNDDVNPPALSFAQSVYTLSADASLVVELQASAAATQKTVYTEYIRKFYYLRDCTGRNRLHDFG